YDRQQWRTLLASDAARTYLTNPKTATPIVNSRKSERAILNSRLILMSGHTARARANSTRSHLLVWMTLAIGLLLADSQRPLRLRQFNSAWAAPEYDREKPLAIRAWWGDGHERVVGEAGTIAGRSTENPDPRASSATSVGWRRRAGDGGTTQRSPIRYRT